MTASVSGTVLEQDGFATHFSVRATKSPSGLRGRGRKKIHLIIQHKYFLIFIVCWESAGNQGWELTLNFP